MTTTEKVLTALAVGFAAGAIVGILYAPDEGKTTRKKIVDDGNALANDVKEKVTEGKQIINDIKEGITQAILEKVDQYTHSATNGAKP